jgi:hypothetical protein
VGYDHFSPASLAPCKPDMMTATEYGELKKKIQRYEGKIEHMYGIFRRRRLRDRGTFAVSNSW